MPSYRTVSIAELTPGSMLAVSVFDEHLTKLLHAGATIDSHIIDHFRSRGITSVQVESSARTIVNSGQEVLDEEPEESSSTVQRCSNCRSIIDICAPTSGLKATTWFCNTCDAVYFGSDDQESRPHGLTLADHKIASLFAMSANAKQDAHTGPISPQSAERIAKLLAPEEITWADRRRHKRYLITVPVSVLPLATDFRVNGDPMRMRTVNVSLGGAALLHTRLVDSPHLAIDFTAAGVDRLRVVFKVLRCRSLGPIYEIGGEYISRLSEVPDGA